jgi:serine/threonine protein kinase
MIGSPAFGAYADSAWRNAVGLAAARAARGCLRWCRIGHGAALLADDRDRVPAEALARFPAEGRKAGSVSHAGIAQVYDYGEAGPARAPYLVMELVNGPSLAEVLAHGPLDAASTMDVLAQAADGMHAAHAAGLVTRSLAAQLPPSRDRRRLGTRRRAGRTPCHADRGAPVEVA